MTGFRCAADSDHQVQADRSLDVCCQVVRTGACDPLLSFEPRCRMSAADVSGRSLTPDLVRQRYKAELPASGRVRRPEIDPLLSFLPQPLMSACQREWSLPDV